MYYVLRNIGSNILIMLAHSLHTYKNNPGLIACFILRDCSLHVLTFILAQSFNILNCNCTKLKFSVDVINNDGRLDKY